MKKFVFLLVFIALNFTAYAEQKALKSILDLPPPQTIRVPKGYTLDAPEGNLSMQSGRYQIIINPNIRADTFLLDTLTGRVWRMTQLSDMKDNPTVWMLMNRVDSAPSLDSK